MEEIANLRDQLSSLQGEEKEYKKKVVFQDSHSPSLSKSILHLSHTQVEASKAELEKLQKTSHTIQNDITDSEKTGSPANLQFRIVLSVSLELFCYSL